MQTEEGFHRIFMSVVSWFMAFHVQEYKWYFLGSDWWWTSLLYRRG